MLSLLRQFVAFLASRINFGPLEPYLVWFLTGRRPPRKVEGHVRQGFVFLINRERVLLETTELCQLKIAGVLKVPPSQVTFRIEASKGKPLPIFEVTNPPPDLEPELVRETMATIYANLKLEMAQRFEGLGERRAG